MPACMFELAIAWVLLRILLVIWSPKLVGVRVPQVAVAQLGPTWVIVRCLNPSNSNARPTLRMRVKANGTVFESSRGSQIVVVTDLQPHHEYTLQIEAAGSIGPMHTLPNIRIRTLSSKTERAPNYSSALTGRKNGKSDAHLDDEKELTIEQLNDKLVKLQLEIMNLSTQKTRLAQENESEQKVLLARFENMMDKCHSTELVRTKLRTSTRLLHESREALETQRANLASNHKRLQKQFNEMHTDQDNWTADVVRWEKLAAKSKHALAQLELEKKRFSENFEHRLQTVKIRLSEAYENLNLARTKQGDAEVTLGRVCELIEQWDQHVEMPYLPSAVIENIPALTPWAREIQLDFQLAKEDAKLRIELESRYAEAVYAFEEVQCRSQSTPESNALSVEVLLPSNLFGENDEYNFSNKAHSAQNSSLFSRKNSIQ